MDLAAEPKHPVVRSVYWREEILELVLWLRGEGFCDHLTPAVLTTFLNLDALQARAHLDRLVLQGYLEVTGIAQHVLTLIGEDEAARLTAAARVVPAASSGPCGTDCWCSSSFTEASTCAAQQVS